ncbi:MAG: sigma-70 family RNA polymerase sigma factor [Solirubrobacterales bacterium]
MEKQLGSGPEEQEAGNGDPERPAGHAEKGVTAARKRAAVEMVARHSGPLKQTARRYSLCTEDAEDAYQRAMEILLTKAPTDQLRDLIRWTHIVVKHEAMAIRRNRERLLGNTPTTAESEGGDWMALIPASGDGPDVRVERREQIARSREALQTLKPAELRALTLLAEGYSYAEISSITGFSPTKVNRALAEGRERFRRMLARSEDGSRCTEMSASLSAFCDGEASAKEAATVQEHLRACASCRAALRAYRAAPRTIAALAPTLSLSKSLLERAHEVFAGLTSRLPGGGAVDSTAAQVAAAGGTKGAGMAALAKLLAVCAGTAGGAAACVAAGVTPPAVDLTPTHTKSPAIERSADLEVAVPDTPVYEPAPATPAPEPEPEPKKPPEEQAPDTAAPSPPAEAGAVEYTPPPESSPPPAVEPPSASSGSAAGEFGP